MRKRANSYDRLHRIKHYRKPKRSSLSQSHRTAIQKAVYKHIEHLFDTEPDTQKNKKTHP